MKYAVIDEIDGKEVASIVEAENPQEAMMLNSIRVFREGLNIGQEAATIGIYDLGEHNHLMDVLSESYRNPINHKWNGGAE